MQPEYGDPELLVGHWWKDTLGLTVRSDPDLRADWWGDAPLVHIQRGQGLGAAPTSLDIATLDVSVYGAVADHVRTVSNTLWSATVHRLPLTVFPNGIFVKSVTCPMRPVWVRDPSAYRRDMSFEVVLHGFVNA